MTTLAIILAQPEDTFTRQRLCQILGTKSFSANVSFFKTSGTVPNQNPFAKDFGGLFPTLSDDKHSLHM